MRLIRPDKFASSPGRFCDGRLARTCPISSRDLPQIAALDLCAFGADRAPLLRSLFQRAPEAAQCTLRQEHPAFCLGRHGSRLSQLGPVVAETVEQASSVCKAVLAAWVGRAVVVDVPASQETFLAWLCERGFEIQRPFTRMCYGAPLPQPAGGVYSFAICGPEFG